MIVVAITRPTEANPRNSISRFRQGASTVVSISVSFLNIYRSCANITEENALNINVMAVLIVIKKSKSCIRLSSCALSFAE